MVMEFVPHSLRSKRVVNETNRVKALADVARALTRVHAAGHVHRDVKARNVLISEVRVGWGRDEETRRETRGDARGRGNISTDGFGDFARR